MDVRSQFDGSNDSVRRLSNNEFIGFNFVKCNMICE